MAESTKLPNAQQMLGIAKESLRAKDKATQIHTPVKDRKKTFYEVGNGNPKAMSLLESLLKIHGNNEIRALDTAAHCQQAIEIFLTECREKGHVANLDDMAKEAAGSDDDEGDEAPTETAAEAANRIFTEQNRAAAGEALDLDNLKPDAPAETTKPKGRGRKRAAEAQAEAAPSPPVDDEVPPAPSSDDFEEDIRPAFLRARDEERATEEQGGTFSRVH